MSGLLVALTGAAGGVVRWDTSGTETSRILDREHTSFVLAREGTAYVLAGSDEGRLIAIEASGAVTEFATGAEPCHAALSDDGALLVTCDYTAGTLTVFARAADGQVSPLSTITLDGPGSAVEADRQEAPHPHSAVWVGDLLLVADLGCDAIRIFEREGHALRPAGRAATPPGSGPRHLLLVGDAIAVTAELSCELLVAPLADVLEGAARWSSSTTSRATTSARIYPSDLVAWAGGIAVANRGAGTIAVLELDGTIPRLVREWTSGGSWPQHLLLDDTGALLVAQRDDDVIVALAPDGALAIAATPPAPAWLTRE